MSEAVRPGWIDLVYEAAGDPGLWVPVMEQFADMLGGSSAWLSQLSVENGQGSGILARIDPTMPELYLAHYADLNPFSNVSDPYAYIREFGPKISVDEDWMPKKVLRETVYYNEFMKPQDVDSVMMMRLGNAGAVVSALNINRPRQRGQFSGAELDLASALYPHLLRAYDLGRKIAAQTDVLSGLAVALDEARTATFILDDNNRVRYANAAGEALLAGGGAVRISNARFCATQPADARRLAALLAEASSSEPETPGGGSMTLRSPNGRSSLLLTVLRSNASPSSASPFATRSTIVRVADTASAKGTPADVLRSTFGLTPAECRLLDPLLRGDSLRAASEALGISYHTARTHLARVFAKTKTGRQTDLIRLVEALPPHVTPRSP